MDFLENHIDVPIKRAVALLNLLGVETTFSCCGFDYKNPTVSKKHILGAPQIMFLANAKSIERILQVVHCTEFAAANSWFITICPREQYDKILAAIQCQFNASASSSDWKDPACPHFHEFSNRATKHFEERMLTFKDEMVDEVLVHDYNFVMKKIYPHWQYDGCNPWLVKKIDWI